MNPRHRILSPAAFGIHHQVSAGIGKFIEDRLRHSTFFFYEHFLEKPFSKGSELITALDTPQAVTAPFLSRVTYKTGFIPALDENIVKNKLKNPSDIEVVPLNRESLDKYSDSSDSMEFKVSDTELLVWLAKHWFEQPPTEYPKYFTKLDSKVYGDSSLLYVGDITDVPSLVAKLKSDSNPSTEPVSQFIWREFSMPTKQLLDDPNPTLSQRQSALVQELNKMLQGTIYEPARFVGVALRLETQSLLDQNPTGERLIRLNRLLLEDAYPRGIARNLYGENGIYSNANALSTHILREEYPMKLIDMVNADKDYAKVALAKLREYELVLRPWLRSKEIKEIGIVVASISSEAIFWGQCIILFAMPCESIQSTFAEGLRRYLCEQIRSVYTPMLTLLENYIYEDELKEILENFDPKSQLFPNRQGPTNAWIKSNSSSFEKIGKGERELVG